MSAVAGFVLLVLGVLALLPVTVLLVEVLAAMLPRRGEPLPADARPRVAVLVPAHNEAMGIMGTLNSVSPQLGAGDRLVVVADNCSDDTAQVASAGGAEVVERLDQSRRGKGYALDFGVRHLEQTPEPGAPEILIIVDADCEVTPGAIGRIARLSAMSGRPVQATYLMKAPESAGVMVAIAEFAWIVKNRVRPLGAHRLGLPCHLMGSGMAFPWPAIRSLQLASGHIVEDMKMGLDFARAGIPPLFCPDALVLSWFPNNQEGAKSQRTRWEHGHLGMIAGDAPRLFLDGARGHGSGMFALALDMCVPPLALLTLLVMALFALCLLHALVAASLLPLSVSGVVVLMLGLAVGLAWQRFGREAVSFGKLLLIFAYVLRKLPLYLKFLVRRQVAWVRSKRDGD